MLNLIAALPPGKPATVKVTRSGQEIDATITVGRRPKPQARARATE
jgi:S1-C subfamily serine protease